MSELIKKIKPTPESYSPKAKPIILNMMEGAKQTEKLVQTISYKGVEFEIVERPDVLWVGCVAYADNNTGPAFADDDMTLIKRYQELVDIPKQDRINPDWSASISINYTCDDKPSGIMFAQETYTDKQDECYEVLTQPGGLWLRIRNDRKAAELLLGKDKVDAWEYFAGEQAPLQSAAKENGYMQNPDIHMQIEYHCHAEYDNPPHTNFAYIPIVKIADPESYSPKSKPEIISAMEKLHDEGTKAIIFGEIELVSLPKMYVASYEVTSNEPEQPAMEFVENWLQNKGLKAGENGIRGFGFDCHKGREIPDGCRVYHVYYSVPESVKGDSDVKIKEFPGGRFARMIITNPFWGDFPLGWGMILKWTFDNNVMNKLGCVSSDDCYSLFSNEDTPCLEELYWENGVQYMAFYLPVEESKPESYSPKNKPEILNMMEENTGRIETNEAYQVKTANGGSYIDGVPMLKWGEWKDCTYSGAVALALNVMGINATYEQVAGLTGSCYRLSMCYGWDPGSIILNTSYYYLGFGDACGTDNNASRAFGYDFYSVADETERNAAVQKSIDSGVPVLCMGGFGPPEWCVLTGYEIEGENVKYFGRSYFDSDSSEKELHTVNNYTSFNSYPGESPGLFVKLFDKKCEPLSEKDALKISLETCLKMFATKGSPNFEKEYQKIGYGAYEFLINGLNSNEYGHVFGHFGNLLDARRAAYVYLGESAELLSGENKTRLLNVSAAYKEMFDALSSVTPYDRLYKNEFESDLSADLRSEIVEALQKMVSLEKQSRVIVQDIIGNWES